MALAISAGAEAFTMMTRNSRYVAAHPGISIQYHLYSSFMLPHGGAHEDLVRFWHTWLAVSLALLVFATGFWLTYRRTGFRHPHVS